MKSSDFLKMYFQLYITSIKLDDLQRVNSIDNNSNINHHKLFSLKV
jgi:hypothetical protein